MFVFSQDLLWGKNIFPCKSPQESDSEKFPAAQETFELSGSEVSKYCDQILLCIYLDAPQYAKLINIYTR